MVEKIREILKKHQGQLPIIVMAEILSVMDEEAEMCEWKKNIYFFGGHDYSSGCGTRIPLNSLEYHKYCPFCGKKIKVVE